MPVCFLGSSPRVRGRPRHPGADTASTGLIPAGAGQTMELSSPICSGRAHPRGCGADRCCAFAMVRVRGSSPRVRGRPSPPLFGRVRPGLIPAGAGQTFSVYPLPAGTRAHPRGCGADALRVVHGEAELGSSPRVRGRRRARPLQPGVGWAHPRGCGADLTAVSGASAQQGSSPRVRGRRFVVGGEVTRPGLIPAGAGQTQAQRGAGR